MSDRKRTVGATKLFIGIPSRDSKLHTEMAQSLINAILDCLTVGMQTPKVCFITKDSIIANARNLLVGEFMQSDCTDLVFWDEDISPERMAFVRLLSHQVDFVGATYRKKQAEVTYAVKFLESDKVQKLDPKTDLLEVVGLPMGFCRITRRAIQRMINELNPHTYPYPFGPKMVTAYKLFDNDFTPAVGYATEDYTFCRLYRQIGGQVWCDPEMQVTHYGDAAYPGHLGNWIRDSQIKAKLAKVAA